MIKNFFEKLNIEYKENISLRNYNTYRLDTICDYLVFPKSTDELKEILNFFQKENIKYYILGNGSNVIFSMEHYDGVIIKLDKLNKIEYQGNIVSAEAGVSLIKLSLDTVKNNLKGLEFAVGIPGSIGASVAMNAGAYNCDISQVFLSAKVLTPNLDIITMTKDDMKYQYRNSFLKENPGYIVLEVKLNLTEGINEDDIRMIEERKQKRINTQPLNFPSAGSVFRNPEGMYAGELIEKLNFKGYRVGGAEVSEKHANFIINTGSATGKDIIKLINEIKTKVKEKYNVELKEEQIIIK